MEAEKFQQYEFPSFAEEFITNKIKKSSSEESNRVNTDGSNADLSSALADSKKKRGGEGQLKTAWRPLTFTNLWNYPDGRRWLHYANILYTVQFIMITLDVFDSQQQLENGVHYFAAPVWFLCACLLAIYQCMRLRVLLVSSGDRTATARNNKNYIKAKVQSIGLITSSLLIQITLLAGAVLSLKSKSHIIIEYCMFGISIAWGFVNTISYNVVLKTNQLLKEMKEEQHEEEEEANDNNDSDIENTTTTTKSIKNKMKKKIRKNGEKKMGVGGAAYSIFFRHYRQKPILLIISLSLTTGFAFLSTYQGKAIGDLTGAAQSASSPGGGGDPTQIQRASTLLIVIWLGINIISVLQTWAFSKMFAGLEVWLRECVFDKAVEAATAAAAAATAVEDEEGNEGQQKDSPSTSNKSNIIISAADYQTRYASDISNVRSLYSTLISGIVGNLLLMIMNFIYLVIESWTVAIVSLGVLSMALYSGPTSLVVEATKDSQSQITSGVALLNKAAAAATTTTMDREENINGVDKEREPSSEESLASSSSEESLNEIRKRHQEDVLDPLKRSLFRKFFYGSFVLNYLLFFSTFLLVMVVIDLTWSIYNGSVASSKILSIFYIFQQFVKAAASLSKTFTAVSRKVANVERIDDIIFPSHQGGESGDAIKTT